MQLCVCMCVCVCVCVCKSFSCVWLFTTPWTVACQALLSMGFSRQEYWSVLQFPSPGDLPDPGIKPGSPALQADSLLSEPPGKHYLNKFQEFFCWECYSYWSSFKFVLRDGTQLPQVRLLWSGGAGCYWSCLACELETQQGPDVCIPPAVLHQCLLRRNEESPAPLPQIGDDPEA